MYTVVPKIPTRFKSFGCIFIVLDASFRLVGTHLLVKVKKMF